MVTIINHKLKPKIYTSAELIEKFQLDEFSDAEIFDKKVQSGIDVYCYICPYHEVVNDTKIMFWCLSYEEAEEDYYLSQEEI